MNIGYDGTSTVDGPRMITGWSGRLSGDLEYINGRAEHDEPREFVREYAREAIEKRRSGTRRRK